MARVLSSQEIRSEFLEFFVRRQHRRVPSSPLVPADDPTLLFTSAGMVQFKPMFASSGELPYRRATSVQKCFRATDLEEVGHTPRHLTFFEMLGNFSFGDYFKREAIQWAWEFCTEVLDLDVDRLWVTVYTDDDEAHDVWAKEIGFPASRIVRLGDEDNFWGPAGGTGACGPSSEIYMDLGSEFSNGKPDEKPGDEGDRFQEFWNLVFPQFDQAADGARSPLANKGIDTGMGLERLAQLLQGVSSVFEIDGFQPLKKAALDLTSFDESRQKDRQTLNIIMEHARSVTMLFHEGIYPSNEGRGYVARRILRRAVRRGRMQGLREPFLHALTGVAVDTLAEAYPDLAESRNRIAEVCQAEETRFFETLETGLKRFHDVLEKTRSRGETQIRGEDIFTLYDTYGFPADMTEEMAVEEGLSIDLPGFEAAMGRQVKRSRSSARFDSGQGEPWQWADKEDAPHSRFDGYAKLELDTRLVAWRPAGDEVEFLLEVTPFYAEGGGQVGDRGWLLDGSGERVAEVLDVQKRGDAFVHRAKADGALEHGPVKAVVNEAARRSAERNHTATHLLHAALRRVLGDHVTQAGSLVAPDRLRFDFHHYGPMTPEEIRSVEDDVNRSILADFPVHKEVTSMEEAKQAGAIAFFGEKYGESVRQVYVTDGTGEVTRELCGGCHVRRTGEIGLFRIVSEESVAAGVRRVEATTGWNAVVVSRDRDELVDRLGQAVKAGSTTEIEGRVQTLVVENETLRKEVARLRSAELQKAAGEVLDQVETLDGVSFLAVEVPAGDMNALREAADKLRDKMGSGVGVLGAKTGDKAAFLAFVTDDLVSQRGLRADTLVRAVAKIAGGGGGGRPQLATAGAKQPDKIGDALAHARQVLEEMLGTRA